MITLPARRVGSNLRAWCSSCGVVHVHPLDEQHPTTQCSDPASLAAWVGYQLLETDAVDDDDLAPLGLDLLLLAGGWRECHDKQSWRHPLLGRLSTPAAAVMQMRLDALHSAQLRRSEPTPC